MSRRTAAALYVGGVGARVRAAAVLCAVACGVACALGAGGEDEGKRRMERRGRQEPPPYMMLNLNDELHERFSSAHFCRLHTFR